jgi:hypothetical protein
VIALAGLGLSSACIARGQPTASPPVEETVDVAEVFATQLPLNNTFYAEKWPELFKRILVSPNVVFAAERNSTAAASAPAPVAGDAPAVEERCCRGPPLHAARLPRAAGVASSKLAALVPGRAGPCRAVGERGSPRAQDRRRR